jgi:hypothetical protein
MSLCRLAETCEASPNAVNAIFRIAAPKFSTEISQSNRRYTLSPRALLDFARAPGAAGRSEITTAFVIVRTYPAHLGAWSGGFLKRIFASKWRKKAIFAT